MGQDQPKAVDWSRLGARIYLDAPVREIYDSFATAAGLAKWFLAMPLYRNPGGFCRAPEERAATGDTFTWNWLTGDLVLQGKVLDADGPERFAFTFGEGTQVRVALSNHKNATLLELVQTFDNDVPGRDARHVDCYGGWSFYLANLKSVLEFGQDLRDRDPKHRGVLNG